MAARTTRKKAARRKTTRKASTRKPTRKKAAKKAAAPAIRITASDGPRTKSQFISTVAEATELSTKEVVSVFDATSAIVKADLGKRGPGVFTVPGLMKIKVVRKAATKARKGINPFTGEETIFKAKPARNVVKVLALKGLKSMV